MQPDDVLPLVVPPPELLVDDDDRGGAGLVRIREYPALAEGQTQRLDVAGRDVADVRHAALVLGGRPFDLAEAPIEQPRVGQTRA